ncbi:MAG: ABC transporter substrate-binding protein [Pseudomonadales bacterium]|nr:ABC transporter substrate-binding protein [Pseudomonadales bacterium]
MLLKNAVLLLLLTALMQGSAVVADETDAVTTVEGFHATLIEVMQQADELAFEGRYEKLAPVIDATFDIDMICRVILNRDWRDLDPGQQAYFAEVFARLSTATYASRFNAYADQAFRTLSMEALQEGRVMVKTEFLQENKEPIRFDYILHQKGEDWLVISAIAEGVNDLALKRAEYATIIKGSGFDGLTAELENKVRELGSL